jgi:hypothetical protein
LKSPIATIAGLTALSLSLAVGSSTAAARVIPLNAVLGKNLIMNPGADVGAGATTNKVVPIPNWTTANNLTAITYLSNQDLGPISIGPTNRGKNYFSGGPNNPVSTASQTVNLSALVPAIKTGKVKFSLTAWLGGYAGQNDGATLKIVFLNASNAGLTNATLIGPNDAQRHTQSMLILEKTSGTVPKRAVKVTMVLTMTRTAGVDNDGLADNLSLILKT